MDEIEAKYTPHGQLNGLQDGPSENVSLKKSKMNSSGSNRKVDKVHLKNELTDSDGTLAFTGESADLSSFSVKHEDDISWGKGVTISEQLESESNASHPHNSLITEVKAEIEEQDDEKSVDQLHTSIEIKYEDTVNPHACDKEDDSAEGVSSREELQSNAPRSPINSPTWIKPDVENYRLNVPSHTGLVFKNQLTSTSSEFENRTESDNRNNLRNDIPNAFSAARTERESPSNAPYRAHTSEKPFSCSHCSAFFAQKYSFKRHMRKHTGEKLFICGHCHASFANKAHLKEHIRTHTGDKPFACSYCSASFARKGTLTIHLRRHTGEKPFACSHCPATFSHKNSLVQHIQMHTNKGAFDCRHCSASFARKNPLTRHMHTRHKPSNIDHPYTSSVQERSTILLKGESYASADPRMQEDQGCLFPHIKEEVEHEDDDSNCLSQRRIEIEHNYTAEKAFRCDLCSASFNYKSNLRRHAKYHTGEKPFVCTYCSASFAGRGNLKRHMSIYDNLKPLNCSECSAAFSRASALSRHMMVHDKVVQSAKSVISRSR